MAEQTDNTLDLYQLLTDPLTATISADYEVADRYYAILRKYAFGVDPEEDSEEVAEGGEAKIVKKRLQTVSFDFVNSSGMKQTVEIPLLTLMPLPLLHISEASFEFNVQISTKNEEVSTSISGSNAIKAAGTLNNIKTPVRRLDTTAVQSLREAKFMQQLNRQTKLIARINPAPKEGESSSSDTNMKVSIKMEQSDMPGGLVSLLQEVAGCMRITPAEEE